VGVETERDRRVHGDARDDLGVFIGNSPQSAARNLPLLPQIGPPLAADSPVVPD